MCAIAAISRIRLPAASALTRWPARVGGCGWPTSCAISCRCGRAPPARRSACTRSRLQRDRGLGPGVTVFRVPARAALAGNPSDGYGGAVLAVPVPAVCAQARFVPGADSSEADEIVAAAIASFDAEHGVVSD